MVSIEQPNPPSQRRLPLQKRLRAPVFKFELIHTGYVSGTVSDLVQ